MAIRQLQWLTIFAVALLSPLVRCQEIFSKEESDAFDFCRQKYNAPKNVTDHFQLHGVIPDESNQEAKCLFICAPQMLSVTDETGYFDVEKGKNIIMNRHPDFEEAGVKAVIRKCSRKRNEKNVCDKWYEFTKCTMKSYLDFKKRKQTAADRKKKHDRSQ